jgi:hypothetical protein
MGSDCLNLYRRPICHTLSKAVAVMEAPIISTFYETKLRGRSQSTEQLFVSEYRVYFLSSD